MNTGALPTALARKHASLQGRSAMWGDADAARVVVFRALKLGDMLCATPALRALRHGLPHAHISLVGLPCARELCERLDSVDEFIEFPGWPGLPEREVADMREVLSFLSALRGRTFDMALQLHGSGGIVNPLLASFGAMRMAGFRDAAAWCPPADATNFTEWPQTGTGIERWLRLTDHLGLPRQGLLPDFPLREGDRHEADQLCRGLHGRLRTRTRPRTRGRPLAVVHAGSPLPSRRWPAEHFAAVADALTNAGLAVVLTGTVGEAALTRRVAEAMRAPALDLAGRTTLWTLGALVERAAVLLCNDTGILQVAAALRTPCVVVASGDGTVEAAMEAALKAALHPLGSPPPAPTLRLAVAPGLQG